MDYESQQLDAYDAEDTRRFLAGAIKKPEPEMEVLGVPISELEEAGEQVKEDLTRVVAGGVRDMAQGAMDLGAELLTEAGEDFLTQSGLTREGAEIQLNIPAPRLPEIAEPKGMIGQIARDFVQFGTGMAVSPGSTIPKAAMSDAFFDPEEGGFITMLRDANLLPQAIEFLAVDVDQESYASDRLKQRLIQSGEGAIIGAVADQVIGTLKRIKDTPDLLRRAGETLAKATNATARFTDEAGKAADARIAQRAQDTGTTLTSGVDPMPAVDAALYAAGSAVRPAKSVDEARAAFEASPNDPALKKQYLDLRRARDAELSQMPASEQLELDTSYRMQHQPRGPQDGGGRLDDITAGGELFPEDVYSADGLRFYGNPRNSFDRQSHAAILAARGNPENEITIYRGVPKDVDQINAGDWVTLSPDYAAMHAADGYGPNGDEAGKVISMKVKVKDVFSDGNDLNEFGYFPEDLAELGVKKVVPPKETEPGIIAFHGSGADFDEFRLEMIGTGEGAQVYGYGLYFTDAEDIAKFYRDSVGGANVLKRAEDIKIANPDGGQETAANFTGFRNKFAEYYGDNAALFADRYLGQFTIDPDASEDVLIQRAVDTMNKVQESDKIPDNPKEIVSKITLPDRGKIYKVGLSPKVDDLLDYDVDLADQDNFKKEAVLRAVKRAIELSKDPNINNTNDYDPDMQPTIAALLGDESSGVTNMNIAGLLSNMQDLTNKEIPAKLLREEGIPGIRYATNDTRGKQFQIFLDVRGKHYRETEPIFARNLDEAKQIEAEYKEKGFGVEIKDARKNNYVIFDDKAIKILEKYGVAGPVAVTALASQQTQDDDARVANASEM